MRSSIPASHTVSSTVARRGQRRKSRRSRRTRLLDCYTRENIEKMFMRHGVLDGLRLSGHESLQVVLDLDAPAADTVQVVDTAMGNVPLVELQLRHDSVTIPGRQLLAVERLLLQDAGGHFDELRPRLPGQRFPGLGMLHKTVALLIAMGQQLRLDGLKFVPRGYLVASQARGDARFLHPVDEARFAALHAAIGHLPLPDACWALARHQVVDCADGGPISWRPVPLILPISDRLVGRFENSNYRNAVQAAGAHTAFALRRSTTFMAIHSLALSDRGGRTAHDAEDQTPDWLYRR